MKKSTKKIMAYLVIVGVIVIPLLYSYLYLGAFWDPYSRLDTLPVAVVNQDTGATINGQQRNLGKEMCDELKSDASLKFTFTDEASAIDGTKGKDYYASIIIPKEFSANIASAETTQKQEATISFVANEKKNFLASQILGKAVLQVESSTRAKINKEIVANLSDKLNSVPLKLTDLSNGLGQLSDGSVALKDGTESLKNGTAEYSSNFNTYQAGVANAASGAAQVGSGAKNLSSGIDSLLAGAKQLNSATANITDLHTGAAALAKGAQDLNTNMTQYTGGVSSLIDTVTNISTLLGAIAKSNPALMSDPNFAALIKQLSDSKNQESIAALKQATSAINGAVKQISDGAAALSNGTANLAQLKAGLVQLESGLQSAKEGSVALDSGAKELTNGMSNINAATAKLSAATNQIKSGAAKTADGMSELNSGISTAKEGVKTSINDSNEELKSLNGLSDFAEKPVTITSNPVNAVPNYGTAFAPYFMSLSLWVGAIIMFVGIFLDSSGKFNILGRNSSRKILRSVSYLLIGFAESIILGLVLIFCLGLKVNHLALFFFACCLISLVFISIVQFLMVFLGDVGKFLSITLLILQLTSCAGTFPMETVPKFFNLLFPFMPMTYSVGLLKEAISGGTGGLIMYHTFVLFSIFAVFMAGTVLLSRRRKKKAALVAAAI